MTKKIYVLDTSVYATDYMAVYAYGNNDIVIPLIVLEELDNLKKRPNGVGINTRGIIRVLDALREKGQFQNGIRIRKGSGLIYTKAGDLNLLPLGYNHSVPDHQIIATALTIQQDQPKRKVIVVSNDINLRIKCDAIGVQAENYTTEKVIEKGNELYSGFQKVLVDDQIIDRFYSGEDLVLSDIVDNPIKVYDNQFVMLVSSSNDKKSAITKFTNELEPLKKIPEYKTTDCWGIAPKNKEQNFAMNLLMDDNIPVVSLIGIAGCGKTLVALASGLQQVLGENAKYNRLIISRPIQPMGKDIGYLPGDIQEKMNPWLAPIQDNLRFLMGNDSLMLDQYVDRGTIEIEAITYIRGRSIQNAFIIIDEAQNLTQHEIKTILTRVGHDSKIILTGDVEQIDNVNIDETSNGLTYVIEKLKDYDISGHITLLKGERSKVATLTARVL